MAMFVLVLLTSMGVALLTLSQFELRMVQADKRSKEVFFTAEAGLEHAREVLFVTDMASAGVGALDDELAGAAGGNGQIDFDAATVRPVFDADGIATGFTGYGDDVPLLAATTFGDSRYIAFLTNDPLDNAVDPLDDTNGRVILTAVGAGVGYTSASVQAVVLRSSFPSLPATITLLGPTPTFGGGKSAAKYYTGDDCDGAGGGFYVPVVGVVGSSAEAAAEAGVDQPSTFVAGAFTGVDTVTDIDATIHPSWKDCNYLLSLAGQIKGTAAVIGSSATPESDLGTAANPKTVYIEGDYTLSGGFAGGGLLWVTGQLTTSGAVDWNGVIFVVGTGVYLRNGGGSGAFSGAWVTANIAGPDGTMWTGDECAGPDGTPGTADDGFEPASWDVNGGGTGDTIYCSTDIQAAQQMPFQVHQFRQR
jgi:hypothetical protein